jgi:hypothetical protein
MIFHAKDPISQDITAGYHPAGMVHIRRHDARLRFFYSPRSAQRTRSADNRIRKATGFQHAIFFLRALRVLRGGVLQMKYQQRETLH